VEGIFARSQERKALLSYQFCCCSAGTLPDKVFIIARFAKAVRLSSPSADSLGWAHPTDSAKDASRKGDEPGSVLWAEYLSQFEALEACPRCNGAIAIHRVGDCARCLGSDESGANLRH
jgi:hypothetical protein